MVLFLSVKREGLFYHYSKMKNYLLIYVKIRKKIMDQYLCKTGIHDGRTHSSELNNQRLPSINILFVIKLERFMWIYSLLLLEVCVHQLSSNGESKIQLEGSEYSWGHHCEFWSWGILVLLWCHSQKLHSGAIACKHVRRRSLALRSTEMKNS